MRELKFRGMDIKGNWHYGYISILKNKVNHVEPGAYISNSYGMPFAYQVRPETTGQYSGIKIDGREIYEDDIISDPVNENAGKVGFSDGAFIVIDKSGMGQDLLEWIDDTTCAYITGNIYENPKLLKESK